MAQEITKSDMDKLVTPDMACCVVSVVRNIAPYLTVGEWGLIMAGVKTALERIEREENND